MASRGRITVEGHDYEASIDGELVTIRVDGAKSCTGRWEDDHIVGCDDEVPQIALDEIEDVLKA